METLEKQLRQARINEDEEEISRIKTEMNILTRNMKTTTVYNKNHQTLSVKQSVIEIVPCNEQKDTIEESIYI